MKAINPYLNFPGTTEEAFIFYRSVFGGEFSVFQRFGDTPASTNIPIGDHQKIMHIALPLPNGTVLMATDTCESMGQMLTVGNNFYIAIEADSEEEATSLFTKLSSGGKVEMKPQKMIWGDFWGCWADRFGVQWMVNYTYTQ